jgi:hypothetical protein
LSNVVGKSCDYCGHMVSVKGPANFNQLSLPVGLPPGWLAVYQHAKADGTRNQLEFCCATCLSGYISQYHIDPAGFPLGNVSALVRPTEDKPEDQPDHPDEEQDQEPADEVIPAADFDADDPVVTRREYRGTRVPSERNPPTMLEPQRAPLAGQDRWFKT